MNEKKELAKLLDELNRRESFLLEIPTLDNIEKAIVFWWDAVGQDGHAIFAADEYSKLKKQWNNIEILTLDFWSALYVNGVRENEGYDMDEKLYLHTPIQKMKTISVDGTLLDEHVMKTGHFPIELSEARSMF